MAAAGTPERHATPMRQAVPSRSATSWNLLGGSRRRARHWARVRGSCCCSAQRATEVRYSASKTGTSRRPSSHSTVMGPRSALRAFLPDAAAEPAGHFGEAVGQVERLRHVTRSHGRLGDARLPRLLRQRAGSQRRPNRPLSGQVREDGGHVHRGQSPFRAEQPARAPPKRHGGSDGSGTSRTTPPSEGEDEFASVVGQVRARDIPPAAGCAQAVHPSRGLRDGRVRVVGQHSIPDGARGRSLGRELHSSASTRCTFRRSHSRYRAPPRRGCWRACAATWRSQYRSRACRSDSAPWWHQAP